MHFNNIATLAIAACSQFAAAHPGEDHTAELAARQLFLQNNAASLDHCADKLQARGVSSRGIERRSNLANKIRQKRGIKTAVAQHNEAAQTTNEANQQFIFASNSSCVLSPEEILGPYYVAGESVRENIVEDQVGVPLHLDIQFIDVNTCEPIVGKYVDVWQCNSTGVYGGVVSEENGAGEADQTNWDNTFLRGLQQTDEDGTVQFETLFPGHYIGRTQHIHVLVHPNATPYPNGSIIDTTAAHVGQMYFDQDLSYSVEKEEPYKSNKQPITTNDEDQFLQGDLKQGGNPIMHHRLVGDGLEDGILAWLSFGINATKAQIVEPTATYFSKGSHATKA